jgi:putative ABC transport system permease protein
MALFRWFILRRLRSETVRTTLTVAGIALGVAVVLAIRLANESALAGFRAALDTVAGKTSLEITGAGLGVSEQRLAALSWLREWGDVSPVIEGEAMALVGEGRAEAVRVLGVDILQDQALRDYRLLRTGDADATTESFLRLLIDPASIVLTDGFAKRHGLGVGSTLSLSIGDAVHQFVIRALLRNEGPAKVMDGNFVLMDIAAAQWAFDRLGRVDRVDVKLADPGRLDEAERVIASRLPAGLAVQRPARRGAQVERMLASFQFNLTALSWVAVLVGLFFVHNTVSTSVIARRGEIGMLRALGVARQTVLALFLGEAAVMGAVGCAVGTIAGWALAHAAVGLTASTVTTLYVAQAAGVPALRVADVVAVFAIGLPLALAAAAGPAREASGLTPLDALRAAARETMGPRSRRLRRALSLVCFSCAFLATRQPPVDGLPVFGFVAALLVVIGVVSLVPDALAILSRCAPALGRWGGVETRLATANIASAVPRLSISVAALSVSLAMLVAIAVMIGSFRETVEYWVSQTLHADLFIATGRRSNLDTQPTISAALESLITSDADVEAVERLSGVTLPYRDRLVFLAAGDFNVLVERGALVYKSPRDGAPAMRQAIGHDVVLVSEPFANRFGAEVGGTIDLVTPAGPRRFRVGAVYFDYSTDRGVVLMDRGTFGRNFGEARPTSLSVYLREGRDPEQVRSRLLRQLGASHRVFVHTNRSLRAEVLRIFDATFAITYGLEAIAILVAVLGITSTMITLMIERRRDLATLRQIGAGRSQIRRIVMIEAGMIGMVGQVFGLVAGFALALILIYVINVQSFGWTIQFHLPVAFLLQASGLLLIVSTFAGAYPGRLVADVEMKNEE